MNISDTTQTDRNKRSETFVLTTIYVMPCKFWCHLYNLKNVKNPNGGLLKPATLLKIFAFWKLYKWYLIAQSKAHIQEMLNRKTNRERSQLQDKLFNMSLPTMTWEPTQESRVFHSQIIHKNVTQCCFIKCPFQYKKAD